MFLFFISIVIMLLCLWSYIRWSKTKSYWRRRGVLHNPPHPIMGSLTFLLKQNPTMWVRQLYKDFNSPYVGIWLFWRPGLVVNCPEISKRVLGKDSENFRNRFASSGKSDPVGALNMFTINDPTWTLLRRRFTSVFTPAELKIHSRITQIKTKDLVQRIREETAKHNYLHVRKILADCTIDIMGESAFGIVSEAAKTGNSALKVIAKDFMKFDLIRGLSWSCVFYFPELIDIFRLTLFSKHTIQKLRLTLRSIIQQRGGLEKEIKEPKDFLDTLIKMKQEATLEEEESSEDFLLAQVTAFLIGGFDTTAASMSWIIYTLAWHPEYQQRLYEEILNAKEKNGYQDFDPITLSALTYLNCVIKETLRIYPVMGWLDRVATKDYQIDEHLTIPAGTPIYVNAAGMQLDPQYYPDPMVFDPDRFLPENEKNMKPFTFLPFGEGPRICIGLRFAYHVMREVVSSLVYNFEIRSLPDTPKPTQVKVESKGLFLVPDDDRMIVQFVPREHL